MVNVAIRVLRPISSLGIIKRLRPTLPSINLKASSLLTKNALALVTSVTSFLAKSLITAEPNSGASSSISRRAVVAANLSPVLEALLYVAILEPYSFQNA